MQFFPLMIGIFHSFLLVVFHLCAFSQPGYSFHPIYKRDLNQPSNLSSSASFDPLQVARFIIKSSSFTYNFPLEYKQGVLFFLDTLRWSDQSNFRASLTAYQLVTTLQLSKAACFCVSSSVLCSLPSYSCRYMSLVEPDCVFLCFKFCPVLPPVIFMQIYVSS